MLVAVLAILLALPILCGIVWQAAATRSVEENNPPPGEMVSVGEHELHIYCQGQGSPTVILEGGIPEWSIHWRQVQESVAAFTRVCAYDRAGYGWSEPGPEPRTAGQIVDELHALLENAGETGPYILVAHSFWGPAALLYQHTYPDEVAGMVLVEAWSPDMFSPVPGVITQSLPLADSLEKLAPFGLVRLVGETGILPLADTLQANLLPAELRPVYAKAYYGGQMWETLGAEYQGIEASASQLQDLGSLGNLPLVVIRAGDRQPTDYPPDDVWEETQNNLAGLSTRGRLFLAEESGHFVQLEQPEVVVEAVRDVVGQAR